MAHPHSPNFKRLDQFYASHQKTLETLLNCQFSKEDGDVLLEDGTSRPSFVIVSPGKAEEVLGCYASFLEAQRKNPHLSACFLLGEKAAKVQSAYSLLKGMSLVGQGKKDRNTPYSFRTFYAAPK
jgi:hypothetical protein